MFRFPYLEIFKKAWELTGQNIWLWGLGLFLGGISGIDFGLGTFWINSSPARSKNLIDYLLLELQTVVENDPTKLYWALGIVLAGGFFLMVMQSFSVAFITSFTDLKVKESGEAKIKQRKRNFRRAIRYTSSVFFLKLLILGASILLFGGLFYPVWHFFALGEIGRGVLLFILALLVIIPAGLFFSFMHLYGPIIIVLYDQRVSGALSISFSLFKNKFYESLMLLAFLLGLGLFLWVFLVFSLLVFALSVGVLVLLTLSLNLFSAASVLLVGAVLFGLFYVIVLKVGYSVFYNVSWVLAVKKMMGSIDLEEEETVPVAEPVV